MGFKALGDLAHAPDQGKLETSYSWKSTGSNKRSVAINRAESYNWHQRV